MRGATQISDYITEIEKGVVVEFGTAGEILQQPQTRLAAGRHACRGWRSLRLSVKEAIRIAENIERA